MRRTFAAFSLSALAGAALLGACGLVEEPTDLPAASDGAAPRREAAPSEDAGTPPLREVTTPEIVDLGSVGAGHEVTFAVPAGALGFNIVVEGTGADFGGIERITSPSGEIVHDAYTPKGGSHATSSAASSFGPVISASVPQSEAKAANTPEPGTWTVRFGHTGAAPPIDAGDDDGGVGPATLKASVRIQMGSVQGGAFIGGRLDLRVYVPGGLRLDGRRLSAVDAETDEAVERRIATFFAALAQQVGIERGEVTFHAAAPLLAFIDSEQSLLEGFAVSSSRPDEQALHLLLTNAIDFGDGFGAWGIAPAIPGAATRTGTVSSGIILAIGDTPAVGDGLTVLHEAGHFFGLNHTTELYGGYADPLADTPKCNGISIDDPGTWNDCPDRYNIMFPAFYGFAGTQAEVSEAQRKIFRGSPIYKAYKTPADGTMASRREALARPGDRITLTKSGRALTPVEAWLSSALCAHPSHAKLDPNGYAATHGRAQTIAALEDAARAEDLPQIIRRRARAALRAIAAREAPH
ncbi:MAG: hypothetical protein KF819_36850 [Labilithrix sp.]|nr:hypothetical protein [Labilithrix sp.]